MADKQIITKSQMIMRIAELSANLEAKEQECERWEEILDDFFKIQYKLADNNKKFRQCLTEIKEIITTALEQNTLINLDKILQKINEVEKCKP